MERVAVVTGAAGGIGAATVQLFRREGWRVVGMDISESNAGEAEHFVNVDLADEAAVEAAFAGLRDLGGINALVNNAAVQSRLSITESVSADWDRVMDVNLRGAYLCTRFAVDLMHGRQAAVVNVSSVHAIATTPFATAYAASKAGLVGLTRTLALQLAAHDIRVNAVLPGAVGTRMLSSDGNEDRIAHIIDRTPLRRIGEAGEIAEAILFLADGNRSSFITGQTLVVDGGALARLSTE